MMKDIIYSGFDMDMLKKLEELTMAWTGSDNKTKTKRVISEENLNSESLFAVLVGFFGIILNLIVAYKAAKQGNLSAWIPVGLFTALVLSKINTKLQRDIATFESNEINNVSLNNGQTVNDCFRDYMKSAIGMLELQEELRNVDLSDVKYISKGINRGENQIKVTELENGEPSIHINVYSLDISYKDMKNRPNTCDGSEEYILVQKDGQEAEYLNLPLRGIVSCTDGVLDFSPLDTHIVNVVKAMYLYIKQHTEGNDELMSEIKQLVSPVCKENNWDC